MTDMKRIAVTIDRDLLHQVDSWIASGVFANRSQAVQRALRRLAEQRSSRETLLAELSMLNPEEERTLTSEVLSAETVWPE